MKQFTEKEYEEAIPKCCSYQTLKQHTEELLLCWGLVKAIENDVPMDCSGCELNMMEKKGSNYGL